MPGGAATLVIRQALFCRLFGGGKLRGAGVPVLGGLQVARIDGHHLDRGCLSGRGNEDDGGDAAIDRKGEPFDQFLVGHDVVFSRRQNPVDALQQEGAAKFDGSALGAGGHRDDPASRRASGYAGASYRRRIPLLSNRDSSTSRWVRSNCSGGNSSIAKRTASAARSNRLYPKA